MLPSGLNANATRRWRAGIGKIALILPEATSHSRTSLRRGFQEPTARVDESGLNASGVELWFSCCGMRRTTWRFEASIS